VFKAADAFFVFCLLLDGGVLRETPALEECEAFALDGVAYEAFNTSGGLGSLSELYSGKIQSLNYKTMRYPGHCKKIRFLMNELLLSMRKCDNFRRKCLDMGWGNCACK
jgi:saccharopine dehydrogenase-like NADP-dependent oxidoreductase